MKMPDNGGLMTDILQYGLLVMRGIAFVPSHRVHYNTVTLYYILVTLENQDECRHLFGSLA